MHLQGTLPFVASAKLNNTYTRLLVLQAQNSFGEPPAPIQHQLFHDLESLFWVLLWVLGDNTSLDFRTQSQLKILRDGVLGDIIVAKWTLMSQKMGRLFKLRELEWMEDFYRKFAHLCTDPEKLTTATVEELIWEAIERALQHPSPFNPPTTATTAPKRPVKSVDSDESGASHSQLIAKKKKSPAKQ